MVMHKKTRVTTFVGTRPEIIRLSEIIKKFDLHFDHRLVHTGQNPDPLLKDVFFEDLGLRSPDVYFKDDHKSLGEFLANLFKQTEIELNTYRPDAVLILGDTNSALSAILAKRFGIPIYHLEAGNRSFDANVPEEINRRLVDHISDMNFPYSELARANLISEGIHPRKISLMGSPLPEVIKNMEKRIESSNILAEVNLNPREYFLVSTHRQENVDSSTRLRSLLETLNAVAKKYNQKVLVSTHPRTRARIEKIEVPIDDRVIFHPPFNFSDYNNLQLNARVVLSDSGTISEEAIMLGLRAITIRDSMERPEALEAGSIIMCGLETDHVLEAIEVIENSAPVINHPREYSFMDVSTRVTNVLLSTVHQQKFWNGLHTLDS
jgi:UDP-N-acetylglucosamine 2-epimerase (non-hydrolysing)